MRVPAAGDEERFRLLFDAHRGAVLSYALRRVQSPADAADVLAETFLVAWRRLDDLPRSDELPWLIGVARLVLRNTHRGHARRHRLAERLRQDLRRLPTWTDRPLARSVRWARHWPRCRPPTGSCCSSSPGRG